MKYYANQMQAQEACEQWITNFFDENNCDPEDAPAFLGQCRWEEKASGVFVYSYYTMNDEPNLDWSEQAMIVHMGLGWLAFRNKAWDDDNDTEQWTMIPFGW